MKFFAVVLEIFVFKGEFRYGTLTVTLRIKREGYNTGLLRLKTVIISQPT